MRVFNRISMSNEVTNKSISKKIVSLKHLRMYKEILMEIKEKKKKKFSGDLENNSSIKDNKIFYLISPLITCPHSSVGRASLS